VNDRYGFNSHGHDAVQENLITAAGKIGRDDRKVRIGLNLGKNKSSPESSVDDYVQGLEKFAGNELVDYFVINISSPNTPGLRKLQNADQLQVLLNAIADVRLKANVRKPIFLKISPDLTPSEREHVCRIIMKANSKQKTVVDGIIVSNTTTWRPENSQDESVCEVGGLSGAPLRSLSTDAIRHVYAMTGGKLPIVGVGGVFTGKDAYEKIRAGASLIQLYTSLALDGPPVIASINRELAALLR
jgi:dihydroorotate dehydrogenase